jgi:hypothetical protein
MRKLNAQNLPLICFSDCKLQPWSVLCMCIGAIAQSTLLVPLGADGCRASLQAGSTRPPATIPAHQGHTGLVLDGVMHCMRFSLPKTLSGADTLKMAKVDVVDDEMCALALGRVQREVK